MLNKLSLLALLLSYSTLCAYDITMETHHMAKEKVKIKHTFKRDDAKEVVIDTNAKLMWQDNAEVKTVKKHLAEAKNYCYKLTLGGFTNWRLPSIEEFESIANIARTPAINKVFKNVQKDYYISASPRLSDIDTIMYMDFKGGHKYEASRRGRGYLRCVRVIKDK